MFELRPFDFSDIGQIIVIVLIVAGSLVGKVVTELTKKRAEAEERRRKNERDRATSGPMQPAQPRIERPVARPMPPSIESSRPAMRPTTRTAPPQPPRSHREEVSSPPENPTVPQTLRDLIKTVLPELEGQFENPPARPPRPQQAVRPPPASSQPAQRTAARKERREASKSDSRRRTPPAPAGTTESRLSGLADHFGQLPSYTQTQVDTGISSSVGGSSMRAELIRMLRRDRSSLRQAFLLSELLSAPLSLREDAGR